MSVILTIPVADAIQHLENLKDCQEWQEFIKILRDNDIASLKADTDKELFAELGDIPPKRLAIIRDMRYRVKALEDMLTMPEKIIRDLQIQTANLEVPVGSDNDPMDEF